MEEAKAPKLFMAEIGIQQQGNTLSDAELRLHFSLSFQHAQGNKPGRLPTQTNIFRAMHALHRDWRVALDSEERLGVLGHSSNMADALVRAGLHPAFDYAEKPEYERNPELTPEAQERFEEAVSFLRKMKDVLNSPIEERIEDIIPELTINMLHADQYFMTRPGGRGHTKGDNHKSHVLSYAALGQPTGDPFYNELYQHIGRYLQQLHQRFKAGILSEKELPTYILFLGVLDAYNQTHDKQIVVENLFK